MLEKKPTSQPSKTRSSRRRYDLGALAAGPWGLGRSLSDCLFDTIRLAQSCEHLGYQRFWITEHQDECSAWTSLEVMLAHLGNLTRTIRLGSGGVLLHAHSPFRIAESFRLLEALFPNRIDLGLAAGFPSEEALSALLDQPLTLRDLEPARYVERVRRLLAYLEDRAPLKAGPIGVPTPAVWLLSAGGPTAIEAAAQGLPLCLSSFHRPLPPQEESILDRAPLPPIPPSVFEAYRNAFVPRTPGEYPRCVIGIAGLCADTKDRARELWSHHREHRLDLAATMVGDQEHCLRYLDQLHDTYGVDEFIFLDLSERAADRERSHTLLAEACGLRKRGPTVKPLRRLAG